MARLSGKDMQKFYNKAVKEKYNDNYEHYMWLSNKYRWMRYLMTFNSIEKHIKNANFKTCLELGPGSGIWTKLLINTNSDANYTLFDVSEAMLEQSKKNLGERKNIKFQQGDFTKTPPKEKFDLFFSSRVIEYIPDKEKLFEDINNVMKKGSKAIIVTKMAHPVRRKLGSFVKKTPLIHTEQVTPEQLIPIFKKLNLKVEFYPAIIEAPYMSKFYSLNMAFFKTIQKKKLKRWMYPFCESYVIVLKK